MAKKSVTKKDHTDLRQTLAAELLKRIAEGTASWQKPWDPSMGDNTPFNAITGKPYRGVNHEWLLTFGPGNGDGRYCTYKQAEAQGWQVRKGVHGLPIEKWSSFEKATIDDETGEIAVDQRMGVRYYTVFHASQIDGIPPLEKPTHEFQFAPDPRVDALLTQLGVSFGQGGNRAFYRPSDDHIQMPPRAAFHAASEYDTVRLHEASHATGHPKRLSRDLTGSFGTPKYAVEELRAEIAASMTARLLGLAFDPDAVENTERRVEATANAAAYLATWLVSLPEGDRNKTLMQALSEGQKISDYLLAQIPGVQTPASAEADLLLVA